MSVRPFLLTCILLAGLASRARAESRFALYFNAERPLTRTVIIYNESGFPLSLNLNGAIDWERADSIIDGATASVLVPGDLVSFRQRFEQGDCITIESEHDGLSLSINNDRDSVYVYAREGIDGGRVIAEK